MVILCNSSVPLLKHVVLTVNASSAFLDSSDNSVTGIVANVRDFRVRYSISYEQLVGKRAFLKACVMFCMSALSDVRLDLQTGKIHLLTKHTFPGSCSI